MKMNFVAASAQDSGGLASESGAVDPRWRQWRSAADLYHSFFTGLILSVVTRRGVAAASEFVFRVFRRQQLERFLPGLEKLGLSHLPPAVAAAQYHYLSNWIGGVSVECMIESDRKAWIRYPPPRWIWRGTAICGIPGEVSQAMLRGWHGNNGVVLGDLRLGFVCTKQTVDGQDGLEGYYYLHDHPLDVDARVTFARHLEAPRFDPAKAPALPVDSWPRNRLEKAYRNYAMEYVRTAAPVAVQLFGPDDASYLLRLTGKLIGMQSCEEIAAAFPTGGRTAEDFAGLLRALLVAQGDEATAGEGQSGCEVRQPKWSLMSDIADFHAVCLQPLIGLVEGLAAGFGRGLTVTCNAGEGRDAPLTWRVVQR